MLGLAQMITNKKPKITHNNIYFVWTTVFKEIEASSLSLPLSLCCWFSMVEFSFVLAAEKNEKSTHTHGTTEIPFSALYAKIERANALNSMKEQERT